MDQSFPFIPYRPPSYPEEEMRARAKSLFDQLNARRSVRHFSDKPVPLDIMEAIIQTAGTAPSGANKQPWTFCLVSNPEIKRQIRMAAEKEEYENYHGRMSEEWLRDLAPLGTNWEKPFLEIAPYLIVVFKKAYDIAGAQKHKNYYVQESVGLACGLLIAAIHHAGLVCLTHTPSPMNFLQEILKRPENEKPFLLLPVGYAAQETTVPDIRRKPLQDICVYYR